MIGHRQVDKFTHGGEDIPKSTDVIGGSSGCNDAGPTGEHGSADSSFVHVAFVSAEAAGGIPKLGIMTAFKVSSVVAGENDERVVIDAEFFEEGENVADLVVEIFDHGGEAGDRIDYVFARFGAIAAVNGVFADKVIEFRVDLAPFFVEMLGRMHRGVWDGSGDIAEEGLLGFCAALDELHGVIHDEVVDVFSFFEGDFLSVVDVGCGVISVCDGLALPAAEFVEAVGEGIGLSRFVGVAEAPFSVCSGGITGVFENFGEDDLMGIEEAIGFANVTANGDFSGVLTSQEHSA